MTEKYVLSPEQIARKAERAHECWAARTPEQKARDKESMARYEATHRAQINACHRRRYAAHPEEKPKKLAHALSWQAAHREEILTRRRARYAANREKECERRRDWVTRNEIKAKAIDRASYARHAEARREHRRLQYADHRIEQNQKHQEWSKTNPIFNRLNQSRRRAKKIGAGGFHTAAEWIALCWASSWCCAYCGRMVDEKTGIKEHKVPLARGGSDLIENMALSCAPCNRRKFTMTDREFLARLAQEARA